MTRANTIAAFNAKYVKDKETGCWLWKGYTDPKGYGIFSLRGKQYRAHRFNYERYNGKIDNQLYVCHHCDVRNCVNPSHLFLGTQDDNMKDMVKKGRSIHRHGEKAPCAVVSDAHAVLMLQMYQRFPCRRPGQAGYGLDQFLSRWFGYAVSCVRRVKQRQTYKHIEVAP